MHLRPVCNTYIFLHVISPQVPCPPNNLTLLRECWSNAIIFSWNLTNGADYNLAKAVDSKVLSN